MINESRALKLNGRKYLEENFCRKVIGEKLVELPDQITGKK
jgi:hypothetical protein